MPAATASTAVESTDRWVRPDAAATPTSRPPTIVRASAKESDIYAGGMVRLTASTMRPYPAASAGRTAVRRLRRTGRRALAAPPPRRAPSAATPGDPLSAGASRCESAPMAHPRQGAPDMPKQNFAARAGRWSAQHRKKAVFGWLAFVVARARDRRQRRDEDDRLRRGGPRRRLQARPRDRQGHLPAGRGRAGLHPVRPRRPAGSGVPRRRQGRRASASPPRGTSRTSSPPTPTATRGRSRATAIRRSWASTSRATPRRRSQGRRRSWRRPPRRRRRTPSCASSSSARRAPARPSRRCSRTI